MKERQKQYITSLIVFISIAGCFLYLLFMTWLKWGDLIIDTFRELWLPLQLLDGKILYKDLTYEAGIFPPYFLVFIYKIFGVHINSLVSCGIGITILMSILTYKISRFFLDEIVSGLVVLTFLFVFAFNHYFYNGIFNFILPYSFASICFILFVSSALYFFLKFIATEKERYLLLWSVCMSFVVLSRIVESLAVWVVFMFVSVIFILKNKDKKWWKWVLYLFFPLVSGSLVYVLYLFKMQAFAGFKESILDYILVIGSTTFNKKLMGFDNIPNNVFLVVKSLILHFIMVFLVGVSSFCISSFFLSKKKFHLSLISGSILLFFTFMFIGNHMDRFLQYRCMPLILIIGVIVSSINVFRSINFKKNISLFLMFSLSLLIMLRVVLNAAPYGYGFYLLDLGLIGYYIFFFGMFKGFFHKHIKYFSEPLFFSILICFFMFQINPYWKISSHFYAQKNVRVKTDRGDIFCFGTLKTKRFWETVNYLRNNTAKDDKVVAFTETAAINFFSHRENPLKYYTFVPPLFDRIGEEKIISMFSAAEVDYIVIMHRPTHEFGSPFFGIDYAKKMYAWILNNYTQVKLIGPYPFTSSEFGVAIFRKKII